MINDKRDPILPFRVYNVRESAKLVGVDKQVIYNAITSRDLDAKQIGKGIKILGESLLRFCGSVSINNIY